MKNTQMLFNWASPNSMLPYTVWTCVKISIVCKMMSAGGIRDASKTKLYNHLSDARSKIWRHFRFKWLEVVSLPKLDTSKNVLSKMPESNAQDIIFINELFGSISIGKNISISQFKNVMIHHEITSDSKHYGDRLLQRVPIWFKLHLAIIEPWHWHWLYILCCRSQFSNQLSGCGPMLVFVSNGSQCVWIFVGFCLATSNKISSVTSCNDRRQL